MAFHITPEMMEQAYEYLRLTPPFKTMKLPDPDELEFRVITNGQLHGECGLTDKNIFIALSITNVHSTNDLIKTMAHEMIHVDHWIRKIPSEHGKDFKSAARRACKFHGWDLKDF